MNKRMLADVKESRDVAYLRLLRDVTAELEREISDVEQAVLRLFFNTGYIAGANFVREQLRGVKK